MQLNDLLGKPVSELTTEELEAKIRELKKLKAVAPQTKGKSKATAKPKSNKDKQLADLIKGLSPEQLKALMGGL